MSYLILRMVAAIWCSLPGGSARQGGYGGWPLCGGGQRGSGLLTLRPGYGMLRGC